MKCKVTFFWAALMLLMLAPLKSWADNGPYAQLTGTTLTFAVGDYTPAENSCWADPGGDWYGPESDVPWYTQRTTVTAVVFDASYATARPKYIKYWFAGMSELTSITGMKENLNTSQVVAAGAYGLFKGCSKLTSVDVSGFDLSNVNDLSNMFGACKALETITGIEGWNTSSVTNMYAMFVSCKTLGSLDLSGWDVSKVETFENMFDGCSALTSLNLAGWNTAAATSMSSMFRSCSSLTELDLTTFDVSKVTTVQEMFEYDTELKTIYCNDDWSGISGSNSMFYGCSSLKGAVAYDSEKTDATMANPTTGYFTANYYVAEWDGTSTLTFKKSTTAPDNITSWDASATSTSEKPGWNAYGASITAVVFDASFAEARPTSCYFWFNRCNMETITGLEYLNTSSVTNMTHMFSFCSKLKSLDVSNFDTKNVETMAYMFSTCSALTELDARDWDVSNVTNMTQMFYDCSSLQTVHADNWTMNARFTKMFDANNALTTIYANGTWTVNGSSTSMFSNCTSLKGAVAFDSEKPDATMANATTGYFTARAAINVLADNSAALSATDGKWTELTFTGRTIYLDGHWNTLCLPISVSTDEFGSLSSTPGFGLVELTGASLDDAGKLTLTFSDATSIEAGKPYLIKFPNLGTTLSEVKLTGFVDNTASTEVSLNGGRVKFIGTWSPIDVPASENTLYLGADDQLNWNNTDSQLQGTRAYFQLDPSLAVSAKEFVLNMDGPTGIQSIQGKEVKEVIFNLQGQRLNGLQKGINIVNGKKIYVK